MITEDTQVTENEAITPVVASEDSLLTDTQLAPGERFQCALERAKELIRRDRLSTNKVQWGLGSIYEQLRQTPQAFGLDTELSQSDFAERIGCSPAQVGNGVKLCRAFDHQQLQQAAVLPNGILLTAARISEPMRWELISLFIEKHREGRINTGQIMADLEKALQEQGSIRTSSGAERGPAPRQLPIKPFTAAVRRLIAPAQELRRELEEDQLNITCEDLDEIQQAIRTVNDELALLEDLVR